KARWADIAVAEPQGPATKAILAIEPLNDLIHQPARKRHLVERPMLDPRVDYHRAWVSHADDRVHQPLPDECAGRGQCARLGEERARNDAAVGRRQALRGGEGITEPAHPTFETKRRAEQYHALKRLWMKRRVHGRQSAAK